MSQGTLWDDTYRSISPKYIMALAEQVRATLNREYPSPDDLNFYIEKWHEADWNYENFRVCKDIDGGIDVKKTLHEMPPETLIRIAIDLDVETPGLLPSIPMFKNTLKEQNPNARSQFERAIKNVIEQPDEAISLANSALEGVLKAIGANKSFGIEGNLSSMVGKKLVSAVIPKLGLRCDMNVPVEVRKIASSLLATCNAIVEIRNDKSAAHGPTPDGYVIDDPLWTELVVNATATVGLFLLEFYQRASAVQEDPAQSSDNDIPF